MSNTQESPKKLFDWEAVETGTWRYNPQYEVYKENVPKLLTFADKASYLQWVAEWKAVYADLAHELRNIRIELSKSHPTTEIDMWWREPGKRVVKVTCDETRSIQSRQARLRYLATTLLFIRRESKKEAGRQMRERRAQYGFDKAQNHALDSLGKFLDEHGIKE